MRDHPAATLSSTPDDVAASDAQPRQDMQRSRLHTTIRPGLLARAARAIGGSATTLTTVCVVVAAATSSAMEHRRPKRSSDPTVGTLPMTGGDPGFDQAITLRGDLDAVRLAVRHTRASSGGNVAAEYDVIDLGGGEVWVRFYGDLSLGLDLNALADVEVALFGGFDGNGMSFVVGTSPGADLMAGYELDLDPLRLFDAGLADGPIVLRALHRSGDTSRVEFEFDPTTLRLTIVQDV